MLAAEDDVDDVEMEWTMPSRVHPSYDLAAATVAAAAVLAEEDDVDDVEMGSMDEAENIEMDQAALEESLFNAIGAHDPEFTLQKDMTEFLFNAIAAHDPEFKWLAAHDPEFKLVEHRTKNKKNNNKKKNR